MSGAPVPGWVMWILMYWYVVPLVLLTCGGYGVWLLWKRWRKP